MKIDVLAWASILSIFGQRLNQIIETEPQTPTVVIKRDWKDHGHDKQDHQYALVLCADHQQTKETKQQDHQFRDDHIRQDRPDEKAVFTFEEGQANRAMMPDVERAVYDFGLATGRTKQLEAAFQYSNSLFFI